MEPDLWSPYLYELKSAVTREKQQKRLGGFYDFFEMEGLTVEEKTNKVFMETGRKKGKPVKFKTK